MLTDLGKIFLFGILILIALAGGGVYIATHSDTLKEATTSTPVSYPDYKNISYMVDGTRIQLTNGSAESAIASSSSKIVTHYFGNDVRADFNKDGREDVAFLLTQNSGGSGTFYYVVAALDTGSGYIGTNAILLGDRISPQSTDVSSGVIEVNFADRKDTDPMTASTTIGVTKYIVVQNNTLVERVPEEGSIIAPTSSVATSSAQ